MISPEMTLTRRPLLTILHRSLMKIRRHLNPFFQRLPVVPEWSVKMRIPTADRNPLLDALRANGNSEISDFMSTAAASTP